MVNINPDRLLSDLRKLAEFGRYGTGVHRPPYSVVDMAARRWYSTRAAEAGLSCFIDGIGNVICRDPSSATPRLLLGSHIETQLQAGWLDGALGVVYALEVVRAFQEDPGCKGMIVDIGAWADEEGHFGGSIGSRSYCGSLADNEIDKLSNKYDGTPLRVALRQAGLDGVERARLDPGRYVGYLEAHIEQGPRLEQSGNRIGIVTSIAGNWQYTISCYGEKNHAGTTPMSCRKDAGSALLGICASIAKEFPSIASPVSVWTTGAISFRPGHMAVIPNEAEMVFGFRDPEREVMQSFERMLASIVQRANEQGPCHCTLQSGYRSDPTPMDPTFQAAFEAASESIAPGSVVRIPSGAVHDALFFARVMQAGMIFIPSIGGISHDIREDTSEEDIVIGCQAFAEGCHMIIQRALRS